MIKRFRQESIKENTARRITLCLLLLFLASAFSLSAQAADEDIASGSNANGTWRITGAGKLIVKTNGQYPMGGEGNPTWWRYADKIKKAEITIAGCKTMANMFEDCENLTSVEWKSLDTTGTERMGNMFCGCASLKSLDLSGFNTADVTDMNRMFYGCGSLKSLDLSSFNTAGVTDMNRMFSGCSSLESLKLSKFDASKVTDMEAMFYGCGSLKSLDLSGFTTANVTNMKSMFQDCGSLKSLDLGKFNTAKVTSMREMFYKCVSLKTLKINKLDTSRVKNMHGMFLDCNSLTSLDVSNFNTAKVTDMGGMFFGCRSLKSLNVGNFDTAKVTDMGGMFYGCGGLTKLDVSGFNTANVTDMGSMFCGCGGLAKLDVSGFNTASVKYMEMMFRECSGLTALDLSKFNTGSATNMNNMFYGCSGLTALDLSKFNTGNVKNMNSMFYGCSGLTSLKVNKFDTSQVTDMGKMFVGCSSLAKLDVSSFDTSKVTNMEEMFKGCSSLKKLDISQFNLSKVKSGFMGIYTLAGAEVIKMPPKAQEESLPKDEAYGWYDEKAKKTEKTYKNLSAAMTYTREKVATKVEVSPDVMYLALPGDTGQLAVTVKPSNVKHKELSYESSDAGVVTVDSKGLVTAVEGGRAKVTVTETESGKTAVCDVVVHTHRWSYDWVTNEEAHYHSCSNEHCYITKMEEKDGYGAHVYDDEEDDTCNVCGYKRTIRVSGVTVSPENLRLWVGGVQLLKTEVSPSNAYNRSVQYTSSDPEVASVNYMGHVRGLTNGTAQITVTTKDGGYTAVCNVLVHTHQWSEEWTATRLAHYHICEAAACDVTDKTEWEGYGLHVYDDEADTNCNICGYNRKIEVNGVTLEPESVRLTGAGAVQQLTAAVAPANAVNRAVTFASSDEKVATVSAAGLVTAVGNGTAKITVTTEDGGYTAVCTVTVHIHAWSEAWSTDDTGHYHTCAAAGCDITDKAQMSGYGAHVYDNAADADCNVCGYQRKVKTHIHKWASKWTTTDKAHYHLCEADGCDITAQEKMDGYGVHVYENDKDSTCNVCGYHREVDESGTTGDELEERKDLPILLVTGKQTKGNRLNLSWNKYKGAGGYEVYWSYCDGKQSYQLLKSLKKTGYTHTKLNTKKNYKYFVVAYKKVNGKKVYLSKSPQIHVAMDYSKTTNVKSIKLNKSKVSLKPGQSFQIKATVTKQDKKKKIISHVAKLRYYSANKEVAKVNGKGVITAGKKGNCTVYVVASNGIAKTVRVTVK